MPAAMRFDEEPGPGVPGPGPARVIVKVRTPGYVPDGFEVRTRIDDLIFTAEAPEEALAAVGDDPQVESVERARPLHPL